jgi:DNA-binding Xre family transcriptional regulator
MQHIYHWKLKPYLERHRISANALAKKTRLSSNTIYPIVRGEAKQVSFETLGKLTRALEELTGERVDMTDVIEVERREMSPMLAELLRTTKPLKKGEILGPRPWTEEELAADDLYWEEQARIEKQMTQRDLERGDEF